jgi:hypothetical protein
MKQDSIVLTINKVPIANNTTMASSFTSDPFNLFSIYAYSVQVNWSGGAAPVGTFSLQGSNDPANSNIILPNNTPVNWTTITNSPQTVSGTPGSILYDVVECSYRWFRLVYTASSGSANITNAQLQIKGV